MCTHILVVLLYLEWILLCLRHLILASVLGHSKTYSGQSSAYLNLNLSHQPSTNMSQGTAQPESALCPTTDNNRESDATTKALLLPEILTGILLELEFHEILINCSRVCRTWKITVDESPKILQKLDFTPDTKEVPKGRNISCFMKILAHPSTDISTSLIPRLPKDRLKVIWFTWDKVGTNPAFAHPNASWRKMLLVQPPLSVSYCIDRNDVLSYGTDVRLGEIYDNWKKWKGGPMDSISIQELNDEEKKGEEKDGSPKYKLCLYSCSPLLRTSDSYHARNV